VNDTVKTQPDADAVADFLRRHPEFVEQHPALLAELKIPHDRGDAVSLVERQVAALREQNQNSRQRLLELFDIARRNQELATRMHQLALSLMDAGDPRDIFAALYDNLRRNFNAERVVVRLFAKPAFIDFYPGEEFADPEAEEAKLFHSIIDKRKPLTGKLKRQQQVFLFGDAGDDIHSAVLVPLRGERWGGVLAIGSPDPDRFQEHMGVELLTNLGEMLSLILKPWISTR
jgi:hypothetical protein